MNTPLDTGHQHTSVYSSGPGSRKHLPATGTRGRSRSRLGRWSAARSPIRTYYLRRRTTDHSRRCPSEEAYSCIASRPSQTNLSDLMGL